MQLRVITVKRCNYTCRELLHVIIRNDKRSTRYSSISGAITAEIHRRKCARQQQKICRDSATISAACCQCAMAELPAAAGMRDWNGKMVPCGAVYTALTAKWRGQSGIEKK